MTNSWFRLYVEFATDPKIQSMDETFQRRYIMFLCVSCNGELQKLDRDMIACALRISMEELEKTINLFDKRNLITIDENGIIYVNNWGKRQFLSDNSTDRVRKFREKINIQKNENNNNKHDKDETLLKRFSNGDVTPPDTDTDTDIEEEGDKNILITFSCNGTPKKFNFTETHLRKFQEAFPNVDILSEVKKSKAWQEANNRKTHKGQMRFINGWLSRANDRISNKEPSRNRTPINKKFSGWKKTAEELCEGTDLLEGEKP